MKMKLSGAEKIVIYIALLAAAFTLGFFVGRSGGGAFVVETEKQPAAQIENEDEAESASETAEEAETPAASSAPADSTSSAESDGISSDGLININAADVELLTTLPGIGEVLAHRIVDYREENGAFSTIYEITYVDGIGESKLQEIENLITVS